MPRGAGQLIDTSHLLSTKLLLTLVVPPSPWDIVLQSNTQGFVPIASMKRSNQSPLSYALSSRHFVHALGPHCCASSPSSVDFALFER